MTRIRAAIIFSLVFVFSSASSQAITVTQTGDPATLVGSILSPGTTLVGTPTFIGEPLGAGTFTEGLASGIGIDQGIILSSGEASVAPGPNMDGSMSGFLQSPGDTDLDTLAGFVTYDATGIEFDFSVPEGPTVDLAFNFVFASEEYLEFVGTQFNDVFGFFVDGMNIGLVPGTTQPITINTINDLTNFQYYIDNPDYYSGGLVPAPYALEYDGFTTVLTARIAGLAPGTHHMKLVVADTSDSEWDSAVFIQAGSIVINPEDPWDDAIDLGGGWYWLDWFGYFSDAGNGWIYHNEHQWMYTLGSSPSSIWFWTADMGWLWTSDTTYPYLYRSSDGVWLWYQVGSVGPRWFYNLTTASWESH